MEGLLGLDNIHDGDELSSLLFDAQEEGEKEETKVDTEDEKEKNTAEVDPDELFDNDDDKETPESVGSEDNKGNKEDTNSQKNGSSPNIFSSIATAFVEEGIFPDLDEDEVKSINDAASLREAINNQIKAGLTEEQKRISEALDYDIHPSRIKQYEEMLHWLDEQENNIEAEGDAGEDLRRRVILQDYINKGFKEERAKAKVDKIFEDGSDVDEAKESLQNLKETYSSQYKALIEEAKQEAANEKKEREKKAQKIKDNIFNEKSNFFGDVDIPKNVRQAAYDAVSKPVYKDPETKELYTAVQKLEMDNSEEFMAKLGLLYALTDGFTTIDKLVKKKVNKEVKKGFENLSRTLNNTARDSFGNLNFTSGVNDDNAYLGKGIKLDI